MYSISCELTQLTTLRVEVAHERPSTLGDPILIKMQGMARFLLKNYHPSLLLPEKC